MLHSRYRRAIWAGPLLIFCLIIAISQGQPAKPDPTGDSGDFNWSPYQVKAPLKPEEIKTTSFYLKMRDGVKIAVSLHLPRSLEPGQKLPAIFHATRYLRQKPGPRVLRFLGNGYAWIDVDSRGTGASFGVWPCPWSPDEIKDYGEIVAWIAGQSWSSGKVGATGISYDGTAAEMVAGSLNPAVRAIVPEFSLFDAYADIGFPGGIHLSEFTKKWSQLNESLDRNVYPRASALPVDEDKDGSMLKEAIASRLHNGNVHEACLRMAFKDDFWLYDPLLTIYSFSPLGYAGAFKKSGVAFYNYSGWFDGAYQHAAIKRFLTVANPGSRLVIGPWCHGGSFNSSPFAQTQTKFDHLAELLRFFDSHLKGIDTGISQEPLVHYYTMGEEKWKSAGTWPPTASEKNYYFASGNRLEAVPSLENEAFDAYKVDYAAATGTTARWDTLLGGNAVTYPDRSEEDKKLMTYTTEPLQDDTEVTGHPILKLDISSTAGDGQFFAYLEEVDATGRVIYVTEGELRALDRRVSNERPRYEDIVPYHSFLRKDAETLKPGQRTRLVFDLLPTSYLFKKGHRIRVALACADRDHFAPSSFPPPTVRFYRDKTGPSHLVLPTTTK